MISKRVTEIGAAVGAFATIASTPAMACSIIMVETLKPNPDYDIRDQCRAVWRNRDQVLADLRAGHHTFPEFYEVTLARREGRGKCRKRPDFAFAIVDAATRTPVRTIAANSPSQLFLKWVPDKYSAEQINDDWGLPVLIEIVEEVADPRLGMQSGGSLRS